MGMLATNMLITAVSIVFPSITSDIEIYPWVEMNLSHIIKEFSFGPHFPEIVQPLDYSYEVTHDRTFPLPLTYSLPFQPIFQPLSHTNISSTSFPPPTSPHAPGP